MRAWVVAVLAVWPALVAPGRAADDIAAFEYIFDAAGFVYDMTWSREDKHVVFVLTSGHDVYRSTNSGRQWSQQGQLAQTRLIRQHAADDALLAFVNTERAAVITADAGETYVSMSFEFRFDSLEWHPVNTDWLLATARTLGCATIPSTAGCNRALYLSRDRGTMWTKINSYIVSASWAPVASASDSGIFAIGLDSKQGVQDFYMVPDSGTHFVSSETFFDEVGTDAILANAIEYHVVDDDRYLYVTTNDPEAGLQLHLSTDRGQSFRRVRLPSELEEFAYNVVDSYAGAVFLQVEHSASHFLSNMYVSDSRGVGFSLSLPRVNCNGYGVCDFERVKSVEGIMLGNQGSADDTEVRTRISLDNGGHWSPLAPPAEDSEGNPVQCVADCALHLHGLTDYYRAYGPIYTRENAVGLILGSGNVGSRLYRQSEVVNTYMSRDGGLTWSEVAKGSFIYEFGDHGALLAMVPNKRETKTLLYSWNQGLSWHEFEFTTDAMLVDNIITEPTVVSQTFIIYGRRGGDGVFVHVDFSSLHERQCVGYDAPGTRDSDYEFWSPHDSLESECLLGRQTFYVRRRRDRECFNGVEYERSEVRRNCACTELDFECDFGFERMTSSGPCVPMGSVPASTAGADAGAVVSERNPPKNCPAGGTYSVATGYRKVAGNSCEGGLDLGPREVPCPSDSLSSGVSTVGWVILSLATVVVLLLGGATARKSEAFQRVFSRERDFGEIRYEYVADDNDGEATFVVEDEDEDLEAGNERGMEVDSMLNLQPPSGGDVELIKL